MMHPHNKENQIVTAQAYTISSNRHTPISCKLLTKFTHKAQLTDSQRSTTNVRKYSNPSPWARGDPFIA